MRPVQKRTPKALPREWEGLALVSQTWVQILALSRMSCVVVCKS